MLGLVRYDDLKRDRTFVVVLLERIRNDIFFLVTMSTFLNHRALRGKQSRLNCIESFNNTLFHPLYRTFRTTNDMTLIWSTSGKPRHFYFFYVAGGSVSQLYAMRLIVKMTANTNHAQTLAPAA